MSYPNADDQEEKIEPSEEEKTNFFINCGFETNLNFAKLNLIFGLKSNADYFVDFSFPHFLSKCFSRNK